MQIPAPMRTVKKVRRAATLSAGSARNRCAPASIADTQPPPTSRPPPSNPAARYAAAEAHARARTRALAEAARMPRDALDGLGALPPYVAARRAAEALADARGWRRP